MVGNPRLREGLAFIPVPDGYVVEGGPVRRELSGRLAAETLPALLPLLDGSRSLEQVVALAEPAARRVLGLLLREDLVRFDGAGEPHPLRTFLGRSQSAWAAERAWRLLQRASVAVLGTHAIADLVAELLAESGVGEVRREGAADVIIDLSDLSCTGNQADYASQPKPADLPACASSPVSADLPASASPPDPTAEAARWGILAGQHVAQAIRHLTGPAPLVAAPPAVPASRRHLTEPRIPLRRMPALAWILSGRGRTPRISPPGSIRTYLIGDGIYAIDDLSQSLVRLPGTATTEILTIVLTADSSPARRLDIDTGHILAQLADDAHAAGWRAAVNADAAFEQALDLDPRRERVTAALELTPERKVEHPRRPSRASAATDPRLPTDRALSRVESTWPDQPLHHAWHEPDTDTWITDYVSACGFAPTSLLVFETEAPDRRATMKAAMAAETIRRFAARAGLSCALLPELGAYDPRTLCGCAFGEPAGIPADIAW